MALEPDVPFFCIEGLCCKESLRSAGLIIVDAIDIVRDEELPWLMVLVVEGEFAETNAAGPLWEGPSILGISCPDSRLRFGITRPLIV